MSGEEVRKKLANEGYSITRLAALLGTSQQNLSVKLSKDSVKTDLLENLCDVLNKDLNFFYGGTKYLTTTNSSTEQQQVPRYLYEDLKNELIEAIRENEQLKNQISLMQQGLTIPEVAQKEVG